MTADPDTKRAVLRGVYEDNLGIPRSFTGKRGAGSQSEHRRLGGTATAGLVTVGLLLVLSGFHFRSVDGDTADALTARQLDTPWSDAVAARTDELAAPTGEVAVPAGAVAVPSAAPPVATSAPAAPGDALAARPQVGLEAAVFPAVNSGQYEAMLSHLGMPVADLFDLKVHTIVIDPGHGGHDPGAVGRHGLMEKDVVLDIARRLRQRLEATGSYRVLLTRDDDSKVNLKERVTFTTQHDADLFISIHVNSVPEKAGSVNYVETYYFGPHADQRTLDLAEHENRDSDYAMGDFRDIIARIGDTLKTEESAQLAAAIHNRLYTNLKGQNSDLLDAGVKSGPFVVLLGVEVPSVLVEISCISNEEEAARLSSPQYRDNIASYLELGIVEYLERRGP